MGSEAGPGAGWRRRRLEQRRSLTELGWEMAARLADMDPAARTTRRMERPIYDVFLGGSCGWTSWRQEKIIPHFHKAGISYYNPQKSQWSCDLIPVEEAAKNTSRLLLFVIDPQTANNVGLLEIAYLAAKKYPLIVVLPSREEFLEISCCSEDSVDRGRAYDVVSTLLAAEGVDICRTVEEARERIEEIVIGDLFATEALRSTRCRWPYLRLKTRSLALACSAPLRRSRLIAGLLRRLLGSEPESVVGGSESCEAERAPSVRRSLSTESESQFVGGPWSETSWPLLLVQAVFGLLSYAVHPLLAAAFLVVAAVSHAAPTSLHVRLKRDVNNNRSRRRAVAARPPISFDVFLGSSGEGGERDWISERAIPLLHKAGLSYFDSRLYSQPDYDSAALMANSSRVLFAVASSYSTFSGIIQLAYYIGKGWRIVACVPEAAASSHSTHPDSPSPHRRMGIARSLAYLRDIASKEHCAIFSDLSRAIRAAVSHVQADH